MVLPALIGLAGLGISAGANLYTQYNQRKLYREQANAYRRLHEGYSRYLAREGRRINPDRAWTSYYGQYRHAQLNTENSLIGSYGTLAGSVGAGGGLYSVMGRSRRRL